MRAFDDKDEECLRALEELDAEKMRQLYVALTRAKRRLYVSLLIDEEQKSIDAGKASAVELFFARYQNPSSYRELYHSAQFLNLARAKEILESLAPQIRYRILEETPDISLPQETTAVELLPSPPLCIPSYDEQIVSFTSLAKKDQSNEALTGVRQGEKITCTLGPSLSPHTIPLGSETGRLLHLLFERIFQRNLHHPLDENALAVLIDEEIVFSSLKQWMPIILPWIIELLKKNLVGFALADVPGTQLQQEMEFFFPTSKGLMKGFCDLLFECEGKYYLLDWKSNYLGPSDSDYTQEKIIQVMHNHDYFLQASIYTEALERYVKLFDNRPFSHCFGGAIYYFIRGKAIYHFIPERKT